MRGRKIKMLWIGGFISSVIFGVLFFFRMNLLTSDSDAHFDNSKERVSYEAPKRDSWMNIFQNKNKIGFSHSKFSPTQTGFFLEELLFMRLNTMGMIQELNVHTKGFLNPDYSLSNFDFILSSGIFNFSMKGTVEDNYLKLTIQNGGIVQKSKIKLKEKIFLAAGIADAIRKTVLTEGETLNFMIFDPATMGQRPLSVLFLDHESVFVNGMKAEARKFAFVFKGTRQYAWLGDDGEILKEEGLMGLRLEKTSKEDALSGRKLRSSDDMMLNASIPADKSLHKPEDLTGIRLKIECSNLDEFKMNGGRQILKEDILHIQRETLSDIPSSINSMGKTKNRSEFLKASPFIQSDHSTIRKLSETIIAGENVPILKIRKIIKWMERNLEKRPVMSIPDALSTLKNKKGDCNEHAVLFAALSRAAGIPAKIEAGLVYLKGRFYYHAWNLVYLGKWITVDALFNQIPADVTHIRFVSGASEDQLDLLGVIGTIRINIVESY